MAKPGPGITDVLFPLTAGIAISAGLSQIRARIRSAPTATICTHVLGAQGGSGESKLTWLPKLGFWICIEPYALGLRNRHWLAYGLVDPSTTRNNLHIRVETALPHHGVNRRIAGLLAEDEKGKKYLLHSGKIGGGKKGFGKAFFWKHYRGDRADVRFDDGDQGYALIGRIDAADFVERLGDFVHGVDAIRSGKLNYEWRFPTGSGRPFAKKGRGKSKVEIIKKIIIRNRTHNEVVNALKEALDRHPSLASVREDLRDLHLTLKNGVVLDVEVKTGTDRYDIYTAVGQLVLNQNKTRLVLVAPCRIEESTDLIRRLRDLTISVVGYQRSGKRVSFRGLDALLAIEAEPRSSPR